MKTPFRLNVNLSETGFNMFFNTYQRTALEVLWKYPDGLSTREVWKYTNEEIEGTISRASIINFLAAVADYEILEYREESGKGGYRRYYSHKYDENDLRQYLSGIVNKALDTLFLL